MAFLLPRFARTNHVRAIGALLLTAAIAGCARQPIVMQPEPTPAAPAPLPPPPRLPTVGALVSAPPASVGMDSTFPSRLDSIVEVGLAEGAAPGAAVAVGRYGRLVYIKGYGTLDYDATSPAVTPRTIYDLASLTKVVATTTSAMILEETGKLELDKPVAFYVPELNAPDKAGITVRMLLTHSGGLEAYAPLYSAANGSLRGRAEYLSAINERPLQYEPGTQTVYSDWDMVLMQAVIERITGMSLDQYADGHIFRQLGMIDTRFRPDTNDAELRARIAPTTEDSLRGGRLRGTVHDANAWALGGVSGHAGLFSTARDLAIFAQFLLDGGTFDQVRILAPQTIARWTARQNVVGSRALGWDTPTPGSSAGKYFSPRSFGHTGYTGTSIWIDPELGTWVVLLANRTYDTESNNRMQSLRRAVSDRVVEAAQYGRMAAAGAN